MTPTRRILALAKSSVAYGLIGVGAGLLSAAFLVALDFVTSFREGHPSLIWFLPVGGLAIGWVYQNHALGSDRGTNFILDEIHEPKSSIPFRMIPLVLLGTLVTHLFGGSAGREGTAVQMGGALSERICKGAGSPLVDRKLALMAGMSAGFASVFGTPIAGSLFGLEVLVIGGWRKFQFGHLAACTLAAFVGHWTVLALGVHHTSYHRPLALALTIHSVIFTLTAGFLFGLLARLFAMISHAYASIAAKLFPSLPIRALVGGALVSSLILMFQLDRAVGLGLSVIKEALVQPVALTDFATKFGLTILTLGSGFKGGEVTPLFYIGATFGNALSEIIELPVSTLAALGFVSVFAGAANVPLASTLMAVEIFGSHIFPLATLSCLASTFASGHRGIYSSQKLIAMKSFESVLHSVYSRLRRR